MDVVVQQVDVRLTADLIEVYFKEARITSHKRLMGEVGQFSMNRDHMPDNHRLYLEHNTENNLKWADTIGPSTARFVSYILETDAEKKALNILSALRNLSTKYAKQWLKPPRSGLIL